MKASISSTLKIRSKKTTVNPDKSHPNKWVFNLRPRHDGEYLDGILPNQHIVLNAHSAKVAEPLKHLQLDEAIQFRVRHSPIQQDVDKVTSRFHCHVHARLEDAGEPQLIAARLRRATWHAVRVSTDVMNIQSAGIVSLFRFRFAPHR